MTRAQEPPVSLCLDGVDKQVNADFRLHITHLQVRQGEILTLLGPSGCGKTTTLRLVAGLEMPDAGRIAVAGQEVYGAHACVPSEKRKVGLVFQDYALFPHLTVADNIRFGLHQYAGDVQARVAEMLDLTRLSHRAQRRPRELSGGEQQRAALARSLAPSPRLLLLDEPFNSLDAMLRKKLRTEVRRILRAAQVTSVLVTHDQEEALSMSDRVAVMLEGAVRQVGSPRELYWSPVREDVARFMGDANLLPGEATGQEVQCALGRLPIQAAARGAVRVMLRPEALQIRLGEGANPGRVQDVEYYGHAQLLRVRLDAGTELLVRRDAIQPFLPGQRICVQPLGVFPIYPG